MFWKTTLGEALKTTWGSMIELLWQKPYFAGLIPAVSFILQEYVLLMISLGLMILGDAILGGMAAGKDFDWGVLFKKTLFKMISYAVGTAALLILTYYPFKGEPNATYGAVKNVVILWMIANEYISIVKNGKKNGVKLGPSFLIKGLKAVDKTGKFNAAN